jgi:dTDP-D-glucose 4,6-dehydratase
MPAIDHRWYLVKNVDKLTYAANPKSLAAIAQHACYAFERADICDRAAIDRIFSKWRLLGSPCPRPIGTRYRHMRH